MTPFVVVVKMFVVITHHGVHFGVFFFSRFDWFISHLSFKVLEMHATIKTQLSVRVKCSCQPNADIELRVSSFFCPPPKMMPNSHKHMKKELNNSLLLILIRMACDVIFNVTAVINLKERGISLISKAINRFKTYRCVACHWGKKICSHLWAQYKQIKLKQLYTINFFYHFF